MSHSEYPTVSIVICTFNGARGIAACLESLAAQTYPASRRSIVLVDDGCTDNTVAIATEHGVRVISHRRNLGVQHARNTGFKAAKSDILVYLDDDCAVGKDWLKELVAPFADPQVVGVGGRVVAYETNRISERFMEATGYGNPEPLLPVGGDLSNPIRRVRAYLQNMYRPLTIAAEPLEAQAVYTANVAYRTSALRAVGGFDASLRSNEDSDVATRLRAAGGKLIFAPKAAARHRHHQRVWHIVRQTFYRSGDTFQYYKKNAMLPPIFPFPILYVVGALVLLPLWPVAGLLLLLAGPVLLYNAWVIHALRASNAEYLLYTYIQLLREGAALLGFIRGALAFNEQKRVAGSYATRSAAAQTERV